MKKIVFLIGIFAAFAANAEVTLKGMVKDANGNAPIRADVHISPYGANNEDAKSYVCASDGSFQIALPEAGFYLMRISAVNHEEISLPLILDETDKTVEVQAQLKSNPYASSFEKMRIIGDWNKFRFSGADTMTRAGDKFTFAFEATGDTLSYQLLDIAGGHSVNGTEQDYYSYDGGGDYRSVIRTKKGERITITFDPAKIRFEHSDGLPMIQFPHNPFLQKAVALRAATQTMLEHARTATGEGGAAAMSGKKFQEILDVLAAEFRNAKNAGDLRLAQFAAITLADEFNPSYPFDSALAKEILAAVPATSSMWALAPIAAHSMCELVTKSDGLSYQEELAAKNPVRTVRAIAISQQLANAYRAKNDNKTRALYQALKNEYGDVKDIKYALTAYNPDAVVQVGRDVVDFELALLDGSGTISNKSLLGSYYLIDFWATWCGPCVREMPSMHAAYEKFKGRKGFNILSISMDASKNQIAPFRAKKWKMPWKHAFIDGIFDAELARRFEVAGIPKPILVDPSGRIVAMEEDLRGENLEKTLERFLGMNN